MTTQTLPPRDEMVRAFMSRDASYEGIFITGVRTTGIFCRPACTARRPAEKNVQFFSTPHDALLAGFRPCKRCRPLEPEGTTPPWVRPLLRAVDHDPSRRWRDEDLRAIGLSPSRVRRWFRRHHGMTFHAYSRARRLGNALGQIQEGETVTRAAFDSGFDSLSGFNDAFLQLAGEPPTRRKGAPLLQVTRIPTPLGPMVAAASDEALFLLEFADRRGLPRQLGTLRKRLGCVFAPGDNAVLAQTAEQVDLYFRGEAGTPDIPLDAPGTPFQETVWAALREIPYGATASYAELAGAIGKPSAGRAVARANGANRIAIAIPCHRVIGSDGKLTGYGGGLWRKTRLLALEKSVETRLATD
jgi:AraC family transcriptional regulator, regulatory protein of adaptative response / methylated-DNA-[protein]-cysteine methyltransferase